MTDYIFNFTDPLKGNFVVKPYTSNGNRFPTSSSLSSTATGATTPLLLYGKGHPEYGERVQENLLVVTENFSGAAPPIIDSSGNTIAGILWHREKLYDRLGANNWQVWNGTAWASASLSQVEGPIASRNSSAANGGLYFANDQSSAEYPNGFLYRYSDDERNIDDWVQVEYSETNPATPERTLMVNDDGTSTGWQELQKATGSLAFLRIDTANDPLTGNLEISKSNPTLTLSQGSPETTVTVLDGNPTTPTITQTGTTPRIRLNDGTSDWDLEANDPGLTQFRIRKDSTNTYFTILSSGLLRVDSTIAYEGLVLGDDDIPNKRYVDDTVAGGAGTNSFVISTGSSFSGGALTLAVNNATHPDFPFFAVTGFTADNITFALPGSPLPSGSPIFDIGGVNVPHVEDALSQLDLQKVSLSGDTFTGDVTFSTDITVGGTSTFNGATAFTNTASGIVPTENPHLTTKGYVDTRITSNTTSNNDRHHIREVIYGAGETVVALPFDYTAGTDSLFVFRNGSKQYKDVGGFDDISFATEIVPSANVIGLPSYEVIGLSGSAFVISGNHVSEFASGDSFTVFDNTGVGTALYTVSGTPTFGGSPNTGTSIPVAALGGATGDGNIGINYDFRVGFDGGGLVLRTVNGHLVTTFEDLATQIEVSLSGSGIAFIVGKKIRIESVTGAIGSVVIADGILSGTTNLFNESNLGLSGLDLVGSPSTVVTRNGGSVVTGLVLDYQEVVITPNPPLPCGSPEGSPTGSPVLSPCGSPTPLVGSPEFTVGPALPGTTANAVEFTIAPSSSPIEILEFVRI